ncbi:MAG: fibronectin type III domain-containing protein [Bdellovibrionales bacterium]|nr:fibronectin type III domain-containing protein [Bdellovibrionales bacterium]
MVMRHLSLMSLILPLLVLGCGGADNSDGSGGNKGATENQQDCESDGSDINFSGVESVSSVTNTSLQLNWTDNSDAKGYVVFDVSDGSSQYLKFVEGPASSTEITGLDTNTSYSYQVKSVDSNFKLDSNTQSVSVTTDSAPPDQLLDTIANSTAVYSVRKLTNSYSGAAIAVRRDSDDLVVDIGFDGFSLDEAALNAHLAGATGFVQTWYDQSGATQDLTQTNLDYQPQIVLSATPGGRPAIRFDGVNDYLISSSVSYTARTLFFSFEMQSASQNTGDLAQIWGDYGGGKQVATDPRSGTTMSFDGNGSGEADYAYDGAAYTGSFQENPTGTGWAFDTTHTLAVEFSSDQSLSQHTVGSLFPSFSVGEHQFGGDISEIIVFSDVKSSDDRAAVESSVSNYY